MFKIIKMSWYLSHPVHCYYLDLSPQASWLGHHRLEATTDMAIWPFLFINATHNRIDIVQGRFVKFKSVQKFVANFCTRGRDYGLTKCTLRNSSLVSKTCVQI